MSSVVGPLRRSLTEITGTIGDVIIIVIVVAIMTFIVKLAGGLGNLTGALSGGGTTTTGGEGTTSTGGVTGASASNPPSISNWLQAAYLGAYAQSPQAWANLPGTNQITQQAVNPAPNMFNPATVQNWGWPQLMVGPGVSPIVTAVQNPGAYVYSPPIQTVSGPYVNPGITYVPYGTTPPTGSPIGTIKYVT